jgi:hypothetical protein
MTSHSSVNCSWYTGPTSLQPAVEPIIAYRLFILITVLAGVGHVVWMAGELKLHPAWAIIAAVTLPLSNPWFGTLALGQVYRCWRSASWRPGLRIVGASPAHPAWPSGWYWP